MRTPTATRVVGALGLLLGLGACQNLYIASDTSVGLQASVNSARTAGKLAIGWERDFVVLIPRSVDVAKQRGDTPDTSDAIDGDGDGDGFKRHKEAMSVASCTNFDTDGIYITRFEQKLATGEAARKLMETMRDGEDALFRMSCFVASSDTGDN